MRGWGPVFEGRVSPMDGQAAQGLEKLIPTVNKLQDVFSRVGLDSIDLPQIAVCGAQSSGKSSVLENLVGKDFLPRGTGIVTRRPLVLQLQTHHEEYAVFAHKPAERFEVGPQVCKEIEDDTARVCGDGVALSNEAISLRIYSPHVLSLTLVDLPGLTKIPVGDQPPDIERQIREMVLKYIRKDNCLILAVTPANSDIANSDALQIAKVVDPQGLRTIGILTKLDLMDQGTDCVPVLMGRVIPLRFGFIGVVNRSQKNIEERLPIREAQAQEQAFFDGHPSYSNMSNRLGIPYLSKTLSVTLMRHVRSCLPSLRNEITSTTLMLRSQLDELGGSSWGRMEKDSGSVLLKLIGEYVSNYQKLVTGAKVEEAGDIEIVGGARITYVMHDIFQKAIERVDPNEDLDVNEVRTMMRNLSGIKSGLFVPQDTFELLIRRQIGRLEGPALQCCELVEAELVSLSEDPNLKELSRYPALESAMVDSTRKLISSLTVPLLDYVRMLVKRELAYINVENDEFASSALVLGAFDDEESRRAAAKAKKKGGLGGLFGGGSSGSRSSAAAAPGAAERISIGHIPRRLKLDEQEMDEEREMAQIGMIRNLTIGYFEIVKKTIADAVPKAIVYMLVNKITESMQKELMLQLYTEHTFKTLMAESGA